MQNNHNKKCKHNNNQILTTYGGFADPELDDIALRDEAEGRELGCEEARMPANRATR